MRRIDGAALAACVRSGWRRGWSDKTTLLGVVLLYWLILAIFWGLWRATSLAELAAAQTTPARLFWYLAVTECIACAVGWPYRAVEAEVASGRIAQATARAR